jgi:pectin methylesterase-like acyl-CoA thioesterase
MNTRTKIISRIMLLLCPSAMLLTLSGSLAAATVTYGVGACGQVGVTSFATITEALEATPTPNVVKVCPGTYHEQVVIKTPLTLEGIVANGDGQVFIAVPTGGLKQNATDEFSDPVAAGVCRQRSRCSQHQRHWR